MDSGNELGRSKAVWERGTRWREIRQMGTSKGDKTIWLMAMKQGSVRGGDAAARHEAGGVKNSLLLTRSVVPMQGKESGCLKAGD
jgi:hypothetical protein